MNTMTPAQRAAEKLQNKLATLRAEAASKDLRALQNAAKVQKAKDNAELLNIPEYRSALIAEGLGKARVAQRVKAATRTERIRAAIADRIETARAIRELTDAERALLTPAKQGEAEAPEVTAAPETTETTETVQ